MSRHYLVGPISAAAANSLWSTPRAAGECLAFDATGDVDLRISPEDRWPDVVSRLPNGWQPDFVVLNLSGTIVPPCLWSAPLPCMGLLGDVSGQWHGLRPWLGQCELVFSEPEAAAKLVQAGFAQVRPSVLSCDVHPAVIEPASDVPRDIDLLVLVHPTPRLEREQAKALSHLARLGERRRILIHPTTPQADNQALLCRARLVLIWGMPELITTPILEALATGAVLLQERNRSPLATISPDGQACVYYTADNLEAVVDHYLDHEDQRASLAAAGRALLPASRFELLWQQLLAQIEAEWPHLRRAQKRPERTPLEELLARCALGCQGETDPSLQHDLASALVAQPRSADLHHALGLVSAMAGKQQELPENAFAQTVGYFRRAVECDPRHLVAGLNLVEALIALGDKQAAATEAQRLLELLDRGAAVPKEAWNAGLFPWGLEVFRSEWERAAWCNLGRPEDEVQAKRTLARWRLSALLADVTGELAWYYEAAMARPDLPSSQAALGCALARSERLPVALQHLEYAAANDPFDGEAARAWYQALGDTGQIVRQRRFARQRHQLAKIAPQLVPQEPWFAEARPIGDELASIIILCCNELVYTQLCVESVLAHSRSPYELILVDNASTDDTPHYLEQIQSRSGPSRILLIRNETNRGFAAGCNQGLARAHGEYLVLLNNDTVVTEGWLEELILWSLHDWPRVGLVGAVANYARAPQQVAADYRELKDLGACAGRRRREFADKALSTERLAAFCWLTRREIFERVGGLDEDFGLGFFEDDDWCVRVRQAGYQLLVALNVYIHHFGSRTFTGLSVDTKRQLTENFERFERKWGPEHTVGCVLQAAEALPEESCPAQHEPLSGSTGSDGAARDVLTAVKSKQRVSLCVIAKNEEHNLPACLDSARDLVDDIVVVDTGSTDRTKEMARQHGARVFDFPWVDSFAAARNETLKHAVGPWIFWLDADDRLDEENRQRLRSLFATLGEDNAAYVMHCWCLPDPESRTPTTVHHVRLFRKLPDVQWRYRVHEQILSSLRASGVRVCWTDVVIHHTGYQDVAFRRRKLERDLRLLHMEQTEHPDDPFVLFNLGSVYQELERFAEALPLLRRSLEGSHPSDSITRKLYALLVQCHRHLGQPREALTLCQGGRAHFPDDIELLFHESVLLRDKGDRQGSAECCERILTAPPGDYFASVDAGLRTYKTRHNLAVLYQEEGRLAEAEAQWQAALQDNADFLPALLQLAELYLSQRRWSALESILQRLQAIPAAEMEVAVLRARAYLHRQEFLAARRILEAMIPRFPQAVWPRTILSYVLLQEGRDWEAAEQVLRSILALDPEQQEARRNLRSLLAQQGKVVDL